MTDIECDALLWCAQKTRELMQSAVIVPLGDQFLAEIPGELGLLLWGIAANKRAARLRLEDAVREWCHARASREMRREQARRELAR